MIANAKIMAEAVQFTDPRTRLITKRLFYLLLPEGGVENQEILRLFEVDLGSRSEAEARMIRDVSDKIRQVINSTDLAIDSQVQDFHRREWNITHANMHAEFQGVSGLTFEGDVNWGRIVGFLAFAVSFGVYILNLGSPPSAVESVNAWTIRMIERDLGQFFLDHGGWEGCLRFSITLLARLRQARLGQAHQADNDDNNEGHTTFWQSAVAVGALGFGALVAFGVQQALS